MPVRTAFAIILPVIILSLLQVRPARFQDRPTEQKDTTSYTERVQAFIQWYRDSTHLREHWILEDSVVVRPFVLTMNYCQIDSKDFMNGEREEIQSQMEHPKIRVWTPALVPGARIIAKDSVEAIFKVGGVSDGWQKFYKRYGDHYSIFGIPIFLRNNTLCLFYADYNCGGLCGRGSFILYKRTGNTWIRIRTFCDWIS